MLRTAERKQLLTGRRLSEVQEFGVRLLQRQDNIARSKDEDRALRLAMLASGRYPLEEVFDEEYTEVVEAAEDLAEDVYARDGVDYDFSGVQFESPEGMDPQDLADLEEFLRDPNILVPTPQIPNDEEWS